MDNPTPINPPGAFVGVGVGVGSGVGEIKLQSQLLAFPAPSVQVQFLFVAIGGQLQLFPLHIQSFAKLLQLQLFVPPLVSSEKPPRRLPSSVELRGTNP